MKSFLFVFIGLFSLFFGLSSFKKILISSNSDKVYLYIAKVVPNDLIAFLIGILSTFIIQSSSSITAITIVLVSCNTINIYKALAIILGSNIGTCFSSFLYALDFSKFLVILFLIGLILLIAKKEKISYILFSICFIFFGILYLEKGLYLFSDTDLFKTLTSNITSPIISFFSSTIIACLMQSSSVVILLIQNLYKLNMIDLPNAICYVLGANVGTCFTGIITSISTSRLSKKVAWFNLIVNFIGGIVFLIILIPYSNFINHLTLNFTNPKLAISFAHLLYNIISSVFTFIIIELIKKIKERK